MAGSTSHGHAALQPGAGESGGIVPFQRHGEYAGHVRVVYDREQVRSIRLANIAST